MNASPNTPLNTPILHTSAIDVACPHPGCLARAGERCNGALHQARINAAGTTSRDANRAARSS